MLDLAVLPFSGQRLRLNLAGSANLSILAELARGQGTPANETGQS